MRGIKQQQKWSRNIYNRSTETPADTRTNVLNHGRWTARYLVGPSSP